MLWQRSRKVVVLIAKAVVDGERSIRRPVVLKVTADALLREVGVRAGKNGTREEVGGPGCKGGEGREHEQATLPIEHLGPEPDVVYVCPSLEEMTSLLDEERVRELQVGLEATAVAFIGRSEEGYAGYDDSGDR